MRLTSRTGRSVLLSTRDDPDNPGGNFALAKAEHRDGKKKEAVPSRHLLNWNVPVLVLASETSTTATLGIPVRPLAAAASNAYDRRGSQFLASVKRYACIFNTPRDSEASRAYFLVIESPSFSYLVIEPLSSKGVVARYDSRASHARCFVAS